MRKQLQKQRREFGFAKGFSVLFQKVFLFLSKVRSIQVSLLSILWSHWKSAGMQKLQKNISCGLFAEKLSIKVRTFDELKWNEKLLTYFIIFPGHQRKVVFGFA